jgi:hypothetical protein
MGGQPRSVAGVFVPARRRGLPRILVPAFSDRGALLVLLALSGLSMGRELTRPDELVRSDMLAFYLPMFSFLGERLRAGDIPGWNPHQFAGAPFAADPESGWMYFPAMLLFTLLPPVAALFAYVAAHVVLAGFAAYALGRALGLGVLGALVSGVVYQYTWQGQAGRCCAPFAQVGLWLPVLLLGAELALRSRTWFARLGWWTLSGFALSQILAAWIGQGAYYSLLLLGAYIAYRTLLVPAVRPRPWSLRARDLALHGGAILGLGFGLAAAGLLPRFEFNPRSSLAGGVYADNAAWAAETGGYSPADLIHELLSGYVAGEWWYAGGAALFLALLAPVVARRSFAVPFFALFGLAVLVLAGPAETPLHTLLYTLLPRFEIIHSHYSHRILIVFHLGVALLAGATVAYLPHWVGHRRAPVLAALAAASALLLLAGPILLVGDPDTISRPTQITILGAQLLVALCALIGRAWARRLVPAALLLLLFWDPGGRILTLETLPSATGSVNLSDYARRPPVASFLAATAEQPPARYFGYAPELLPPLGQMEYGYLRSADLRVIDTLVNNRATLLGLYDVQGYNPVQVKRYVEYVAALNGSDQEYHEANVFREGFDSPLLDLLNTRYIVAWAPPATASEEVQSLVRHYPSVVSDPPVRILDNPGVLPRAWIVYEAQQVDRGEALPLLGSGQVDPRRTVLLETVPPVLADPPPASGEATFTHYEPDRIRLDVRSEAPGILVLSETYDPNWNAYIDGAPAPLLVANHALRAVPLPTGEHQVELRYESLSLKLGIMISATTYAALATLGLVALWRRRWHGHGADPTAAAS